MEWRDSEAHARSDADPLRGALSGRHRPSLGQGRRRPRSVVLIRHRDGDDRPKISQLHAQLSEFDPALRKTGDWNCCRVGALFSSIRSRAIISIVSLRVAENGLWKFRSSVMSTQ